MGALTDVAIRSAAYVGREVGNEFGFSMMHGRTYSDESRCIRSSLDTRSGLFTCVSSRVGGRLKSRRTGDMSSCSPGSLVDASHVVPNKIWFKERSID